MQYVSNSIDRAVWGGNSPSWLHDSGAICKMQLHQALIKYERPQRSVSQSPYDTSLPYPLSCRVQSPKTPSLPIIPNHSLTIPSEQSGGAYVTLHNSSASRMNFPSLYFSLASNALSYFHPTVSLHCRHAISLTICRPVVMFRSEASPAVTFTTLLKR